MGSGGVSGGGDLVDFDERDLLGFAEQAGFAEICLEYEARIERGGLAWEIGQAPWESFIRTAPNPHALTLEEAMDRALSAEERAAFEAYIRPRYEAHDGIRRAAFAHLRAVKR